MIAVCHIYWAHVCLKEHVLVVSSAWNAFARRLHRDMHVADSELCIKPALITSFSEALMTTVFKM